MIAIMRHIDVGQSTRLNHGCWQGLARKRIGDRLRHLDFTTVDPYFNFFGCRGGWLSLSDSGCVGHRLFSASGFSNNQAGDLGGPPPQLEHGPAIRDIEFGKQTVGPCNCGLGFHKRPIAGVHSESFLQLRTPHPGIAYQGPAVAYHRILRLRSVQGQQCSDRSGVSLNLSISIAHNIRGIALRKFPCVESPAPFDRFIFPSCFDFCRTFFRFKAQ